MEDSSLTFFSHPKLLSSICFTQFALQGKDVQEDILSLNGVLLKS